MVHLDPDRELQSGQGFDFDQDQQSAPPLAFWIFNLKPSGRP